MSNGQSTPPPGLRRDWIAGTVVIAAVILAAVQYAQFVETARWRWDGPAHDRNAHYLLGLSLAQAARDGDAGTFLAEINRARTWPPLHGVLLAGVLLAGGPNHRLAIGPSLLAWAAAIVLVFLLARRLAPRGGTLAGLVAAACFAASPAHRVYATDVMLESLGAALTLAALYAYVVVAQTRTAGAATGLGVTLTLLFLTKYNYWLLVVGGLAVAELAMPPRRLHELLEASKTIEWRRWAGAQLRRPLNVLLLVLLALIATIAAHGPAALAVAGRRIALYPPDNLTQVAYVLLFVQTLRWWRTGGGAWAQTLSAPMQRLIRWHAWPVALWLLLPKRPGRLLAFLGPANLGENPTDLRWGLDFYAHRLVADYHSGWWSALACAGLLLTALLAVRRLRPGAGAVVAVLALAAVLTVGHPNRKSRYLHSWVPAAWVLAGLGLVTVAEGRGRNACSMKQRAAAGGAALALVAWQIPASTAPGHSPESGQRGEDASSRDLTDYYLPLLAASRRAAFVSTVPMDDLARWSILEAYGDRDRLELPLRHLGRDVEENRRRFAAWLGATTADTMVFVDVPEGSYFSFGGFEQYRLAGELLAAQSVFAIAHRRHFPRYGCTVSIWTRRS